MAMAVAPSWVDVDGIRTRYFEAGKGEPILFITGSHYGNTVAASPAETWEYNIGPLSQRYRVIVVDKLGHGHTENPRNGDYTQEAVHRHLVAFMRVMNLEGTHVVGQSAGALPAAALPHLVPERVRSLTVINSSSLAPGVSLNEVNYAGCPHPAFSREGQRWLFERCAYDLSSVSENFVEAGFEVMSQPKYRESSELMEKGGLKNSLFRPDLAKVKHETLQRIADAGSLRPTQVIWGAEDHSSSIERGLMLYRTIAAHERQAYFHVVAAAGHHPYREHPEQFNELMTGFIGSLN